jgi:hypothetical protein
MRHARREIAKRAVGSLRGSPAQYLATTYQCREDGAEETDMPIAGRAGAGRGVLAGGLTVRFLFAVALLLLALILLSLVLWASLSWAATTRCLTYEERSLGRLQTLCDDSTRAVHTWNRTLFRWESTITPPPGQTCEGRLNPKTRQVEVRCR